MIEKVFAAIVLLFSIAMVIACGYFGGKSIEEKDFRTAGGLLSCEMIFLIVIIKKIIIISQKTTKIFGGLIFYCYLCSVNKNNKK